MKQIVIKLSDEIYKECCADEGRLNIIWDLVDAVRKGTPLPKGHGVLKDADGLLEMTKSYKSELGRLKADPFVKSGIETVEGFIREMPTIIEADKAESEG